MTAEENAKQSVNPVRAVMNPVLSLVLRQDPLVIRAVDATINSVSPVME